MTDSSAPTPRKIGRPRLDNPMLRELLLDTALASFTNVGVAATSVRSIAADAGVSAPLVSYYFGTKDDLVKAVYEERFGTVMASLELKMRSVEEGIDVFLEVFAKTMFETIAENPWYPQLWVREVLCESGAFVQMHQARFRELNLHLVQRFKDAQEAGLASRELDPELVMTTLLSLVLLPEANRRLTESVYGPKSDAVREKHTLSVIKRGLLLDPS
jgi:TetR/AcrR family transcriptional regulator